MTSLPQACLTMVLHCEQRPESENKKISGSCLPYSDRRYIIDASTGSVFFCLDGEEEYTSLIGCVFCVVEYFVSAGCLCASLCTW